MVKLVSLTQSSIPGLTPEELIVYVARVSAPDNQLNVDTAPNLLRYLIRNKHWSPFDMVDMTVEIETSRGLAPQFLRHWSFKFQEFSQRYAEVHNFELYSARSQHPTNRQLSLDDLTLGTQLWFKDAQQKVAALAESLYGEALEQGIAKECARFLLPLTTKTRFYMKGSVRSWLHYLEVRLEEGVQEEHRQIARDIKSIFKTLFPIVSEAVWGKENDHG